MLFGSAGALLAVAIALLVVAIALLAMAIVPLLVVVVPLPVGVIALLVAATVSTHMVVIIPTALAMLAMVRIAVPTSLFGGPRTMVVEGCRGIGGVWVHWGRGGHCGVGGVSGGWGWNVLHRGMGQGSRRGSRCWLRRSRVADIIRVRRIGV